MIPQISLCALAALREIDISSRQLPAAKIGYNWHELNLHEANLMLKIKNGKKKVRPNTRYPNDVRMAIEMDQGYPLTTTQDVTLEQMAAAEQYTVKQVVERLVELRPASRTGK